MAATEGDADELTLLLQLSEPHLCLREGEPEKRLARAVAAAAELQPRPLAVLLTGDVADEPAGEVYARAHSIVAPLGIPVHAIPGNHDDRDLLAMEFAGRGSATGEPVHVLAYVGALRLVGLDTTVPGTPGGALEPSQLEWLGGEPPARAAPATP